MGDGEQEQSELVVVDDEEQGQSELVVVGDEEQEEIELVVGEQQERSLLCLGGCGLASHVSPSAGSPLEASTSRSHP